MGTSRSWLAALENAEDETIEAARMLPSPTCRRRIKEFTRGPLLEEELRN